MRTALVLLLTVSLCTISLANNSGFSNLSYGITEGTKDLQKALTTQVELNYLRSALAISGTVITSIFDKPVYDYFSELKSLRATAAVVSKSVEPIGLGILYTTLGWNNKEFARKMIGSSLFTGINVNGAKYLLGKARPSRTGSPFYIGPNFKSEYNSFPSGHTALSFSLATVLSSEYPKYSFLFYTWSSGVGLSRVILQRHWISDVFGGAITGTLSANHYLKSINSD